MGLEESGSKPGRSEDLGSAAEQARVAQQVHDYFEAAEPKRAPKPARSDENDANAGSDSQVPVEIPELRKFQELEAGNEHLDFIGDHEGHDDEFVETEYYKDLAAAEKGQHHTTGTGFISVATDALESFHIEPEEDLPPLERTRSRSNPATNEWEPSSEVVMAASGKPPRSEN